STLYKKKTTPSHSLSRVSLLFPFLFLYFVNLTLLPILNPFPFNHLIIFRLVNLKLSPFLCLCFSYRMLIWFG
ncbi:hypothetical protein LINGRAPRIM_LOCUS755, partial [Linum grandiflorum]